MYNQKIFNGSCESAFIDLKMAWMYLRLEAAMLSSRLISKPDGKVLSFNLFHTLQHYSWVTFCALGQNFLPAQSLDLRPKFWAGKISRPKFGPNSAQKKSLETKDFSGCTQHNKFIVIQKILWKFWNFSILKKSRRVSR